MPVGEGRGSEKKNRLPRLACLKSQARRLLGYKQTYREKKKGRERRGMGCVVFL